jgi:membrane-bound serine protease (ClpP class)
VRAVLLIIMLLGAYMEFHAPGVILPGAVALVALAGLLIPPFLVGLGAIWHILLFGAGVILLTLEIWIPHFGVVGILGIILIFVSLVLAAVPTGPQFSPVHQTMSQLQASVLALTVALVVSAVGFYFITKHFGSLPLVNRLVLKSPLPGTTMPPAAADDADEDGPVPSGPPRSGASLGAGVQPGAVGQVVTYLRPSGRAQFGQRVVHVVSVGDWIEPGRPVRVVAVHGNRVVVEAA